MPQPLSTYTDIQRLLNGGVQEFTNIEYKRELPGDTDKAKWDFRADVCAMANTTGGHIIHGVIEKNKVPIDIPGLSEFDLDATELRLRSILLTGIEPRLSIIRMWPVEGFTNGPVFVVHVPQSWSAPHAVHKGDSWQFYGRHDAGN